MNPNMTGLNHTGFGASCPDVSGVRGALVRFFVPAMVKILSEFSLPSESAQSQRVKLGEW